MTTEEEKAVIDLAKELVVWWRRYLTPFSKGGLRDRLAAAVDAYDKKKCEDDN